MNTLTSARGLYLKFVRASCCLILCAAVARGFEDPKRDQEGRNRGGGQNHQDRSGNQGKGGAQNQAARPDHPAGGRVERQSTPPPPSTNQGQSQAGGHQGFGNRSGQPSGGQSSATQQQSGSTGSGHSQGGGNQGFGNRTGQPSGGQNSTTQQQGSSTGSGSGAGSGHSQGGGNQGFGNRSAQPSGGQNSTTQQQGSSTGSGSGAGSGHSQGGGSQGFGNRTGQPSGGQNSTTQQQGSSTGSGSGAGSGHSQSGGNQGFGNRTGQPSGGQNSTTQQQGSSTGSGSGVGSGHSQGGGNQGLGNRTGQPSGGQNSTTQQQGSSTGSGYGNRSGQSQTGGNQGYGNRGNTQGNESSSMVQRWNRERTGQGGVNSRPLPQGEVSRTQTGNYSLRTNSGREYNIRPDGGVSSYRGANNSEAHFRPDGSVREVRKPGMTVLHGPAGTRRVIVQRSDHSMLVASGAGHGYIQRQIAVRNQNFVARTYYRDRVASVRYYRPLSYHGLMLNSYVPVRYHPLGFYSWAYSPWRAPVAYRWGWFGSPWYSYYGPYFSPYVSYPSATYWLTDYLFAAAIETAYRERMEAADQRYRNDGPVSQAAITPEVKQMVAEEVRRQLQWEQAEGDAAMRNGSVDPSIGGLPRLLSDGAPHAFVVSEYLEVDANGMDCALTPGDVIRLDTPPPPDSPAAWLRVISSKHQDCRPGAMVAVPLADLQEMNNYLRDTVDDGLSQLRARQGREGLPAAPVAAVQGGWEAPYASAVAPDPNGAGDLQQQMRYASDAEQEVVGQAFAQDTAPPPVSRSGYGAPPPAVVWVFRTKGNLFRPSVFVNGEELVRLGGGRRIKLVLAPGRTDFQLDNPRAEVLPMDLRPGEVYYLEGRFSGDRKDFLEWVHPARGEQEVSKLAPVEAQWIRRPDIAIAQ